ncbi:MAG: hypothetical protein ABIP61_07910, partial [Burkholderiaceae bacterium]
GRRRSRWRMPRWLILLLVGVLIGAGGVLFVQERYLPPRLSADASTQLRHSAEQAQAQQLRLDRELRDAEHKLKTALADSKRFASELATSRATVERLRQDVASVVAALPPDPRAGIVQVRAARFAPDHGALAYDVVLSRATAAGQPLTGVMQLVVAGESGRGARTTITLGPVAFSIAGYQSLRGNLPLPDGFQPRQATVRVLDRVDGKLLGMRVLYVE